MSENQSEWKICSTEEYLKISEQRMVEDHRVIARILVFFGFVKFRYKTEIRERFERKP